MPVVITIYVNSAVKTAHELRYLRQKCTVKYLIKMVVKIQLQATKLHSTGFSLINVQFVLGKWLKLRREIHYEIVVRLINARIQCTANYTGPSVNMCSALTKCSTAERVSQSAKKIQKRIKKTWAAGRAEEEWKTYKIIVSIARFSLLHILLIHLDWFCQ